MAQKETQFDFSKESRIEPQKVDWSKYIQPTLAFTKRHKEWLMLGLAAFIVIKGVAYIFSDSPEEIKTKTIAMQTAAANIPAIVQAIDKSKNSYDEIVTYLMTKEFEIQTNSMKTMQNHSKNLSDLNIAFKKSVNQKQESLEIIDKKIKEDKSFNSLTSDEKSFLLKEYAAYKAEDKYSSGNLDAAINTATTIENDDKPTDDAKIKELNNMRETFKKEVAEIKKKSFKK